MAHGKSLELARIQPVIHRYLRPDQYSQHLKAIGKVPGDPKLWPRGAVPLSRRERRKGAGDPYIYRQAKPRRRRRAASGQGGAVAS